MKLYKFRDLTGCNRARVQRIVEDHEIWFANPTAFNDPFDCNIEPTFDATDAQRKTYWRNAIAFQLAKKGYYQIEDDFAQRVQRGEIDAYDEIMRRAREREISVSVEFLESIFAENFSRDADEDEREKIISGFRGHMKTLGVLSLAGTCENILLWSHYADSHRGLCLEFEVEPGSTPMGSHHLSSARQVHYLADHPDISLYEPVDIVLAQDVPLYKG